MLLLAILTFAVHTFVVVRLLRFLTLFRTLFTTLLLTLLNLFLGALLVTVKMV
jgi:hypothetical protein